MRTGRDIRPIVTTVAPTIPVLAANRAPTTIIDMLRPPLIFLNAKAMFSNIFAAMPDLSRTVPININKGTARRVTLFIIPNILRGILFKMDSSNIPNGMQIRAKRMEIPESVNATGYPNKRARQIKTKSNKGIISILFL
jgi:hypothetical protein